MHLEIWIEQSECLQRAMRGAQNEIYKNDAHSSVMITIASLGVARCSTAGMQRVARRGVREASVLFRYLSSSSPISASSRTAISTRAYACACATWTSWPVTAAVHESSTHVSITPCTKSSHPRAVAHRLRQRGEADMSLQILERYGAAYSRDESDLIELLLAQSVCNRYSTNINARLYAMLYAMCVSPTLKSRLMYNIILSTASRHARRASAALAEELAHLARVLWYSSPSNASFRRNSAPVMLRLAGDCRDLNTVRNVWREAVAAREEEEALDCEGYQAGGYLENEYFVKGWKKRRRIEEHLELHRDILAAYILALGKCARSSEAEGIFYGRDKIATLFRTHRSVLCALFESYVASARIGKAEALVLKHGAELLTITACNAFVEQCSQLQLHDTASKFVSRMRSPGFPNPSARTYNLLLQAISAGTGNEDRAVAADRALKIVQEMREEGIAPTTVTYNTVIRSLVFRGQLQQALRMYEGMHAPNRITFSHLMQGAANFADVDLARRLLKEITLAKERPNYGFCKSFLETVAKTEGTAAAFDEAKRLATEFKHVLVFGDVGGTEAIRMSLIAACGKVGQLEAAFNAFNLQLTEPGVAQKRGKLAPLYLATVLLQVCIQCKRLDMATELFKAVKDAGVKPNFEVYESLIYGLAAHARHISTAAQDAPARREQAEYANISENEQQYMQDGSTLNWGKCDANNDDAKTRTNANSKSAHQALQMAVQLVQEMHQAQCARKERQAAYVYNAMIAAAGCTGEFELALNIFHRMCRHTNPGVVYFAKESADASACASIRTRENIIFDMESTMEFPAATVGTYNSMMDTARKCGEIQFAFSVYDMLNLDRINEPNAATMNLIAGIALDCDGVPVDAQKKLLKDLDRIAFLPEQVAKKRVQLRQKVLALHWQ